MKSYRWRFRRRARRRGRHRTGRRPRRRRGREDTTRARATLAHIKHFDVYYCVWCHVRHPCHAARVRGDLRSLRISKPAARAPRRDVVVPRLDDPRAAVGCQLGRRILSKLTKILKDGLILRPRPLEDLRVEAAGHAAEPSDPRRRVPRLHVGTINTSHLHLRQGGLRRASRIPQYNSSTN